MTDIQRTAGGAELFDTLTVFESYPIDEEGIARESRAVGELAVSHVQSFAATDFALRLRIHLPDRLHVAFEYRTDRSTDETGDPQRPIRRVLESCA